MSLCWKVGGTAPTDVKTPYGISIDLNGDYLIADGDRLQSATLRSGVGMVYHGRGRDLRVWPYLNLV